MHCKQYGHAAATCYEHFLQCVSTRVCICSLYACLCVCQSVDVGVIHLHDLSVTWRFRLACFCACACICELVCVFAASVCVHKCIHKVVVLRVWSAVCSGLNDKSGAYFNLKWVKLKIATCRLIKIWNTIALIMIWNTIATCRLIMIWNAIATWRKTVSDWITVSELLLRHHNVLITNRATTLWNHHFVIKMSYSPIYEQHRNHNALITN